MSNTFVPILISFLLLNIFSCKKVEKQTEFDIDYSTTLSVPSNSVAVNSPTTSVEFITPNIPTEQATKFEGAGTAQSLIDQIKLSKFNISSVGTGSNLDYLKSISIYIKAVNVGEELVGFKNSISKGLTSLSLDLNDVNIKNYLFQNNIQFIVVIHFDANSAIASQTLKLDETVHVKAKLLP